MIKSQVKKHSVVSSQWSENNKRLTIPPRLLNRQDSPLLTGLTLIEIIVVMAILSLIATTIFTVFYGGLLAYRKCTSRALVYSEARAALDMMSREIEKAIVDERKTIYYELWNGSSGYRTESKGDEFYFIAPIDNSGTADLCEVGYWLSNDNVLRRYFVTDESSYFDYDFRTYDENASTNLGLNELIGNITDLDFWYWDGFSFVKPPSGSFIASDIRLPSAIKISLTMRYEKEREEVKYDTFTTIVYIPGSGQ